MSNKNVPELRVVDRDGALELPDLSDELRLAFADVVGAAREGLLAMSVGVGLRVFAEMMEEELALKVGPKHAKCPDRTRVGTEVPRLGRPGRQAGPVERPRARTKDGTRSSWIPTASSQTTTCSVTS